MLPARRCSNFTVALPFCYRNSRHLAFPCRLAAEELATYFQRAMVELNERGCDQMPQTLHVSVDTQRIRLLAQQRLQEFQILCVTQE